MNHRSEVRLTLRARFSPPVVSWATERGARPHGVRVEAVPFGGRGVVAAEALTAGELTAAEALFLQQSCSVVSAACARAQALFPLAPRNMCVHTRGDERLILASPTVATSPAAQVQPC